MPSAPPTAPIADWYPDPEDSDGLRYWNGTEWTEHRAPRVAGLRSVGDWLSATFSNAWKRLSSVAWLWAVLQVPMAVFMALALAWAIDPLRITGYREGDFRVEGVSAARLVVGGFVVLAAIVAYGAFTNALRYLMYHSHRGDEVRWSEAMAVGVRRTPRWLAWLIATTAVLLVVLLPFVGLGFAIGVSEMWPLFLLLVPIAVVALVLIGTRLYFVLTGIAVAPLGSNPISISWQAVKGKFWPIFGRVLLWGIIASVVGSVFNAVVSQLTTGWLVNSLDSLDVIDIAGGVDVRLDGRSLESVGLSDLVDGGPGLALAMILLFVFGALTQAVSQALSASADTNLYLDLEAPAAERATTG